MPLISERLGRYSDAPTNLCCECLHLGRGQSSICKHADLEAVSEELQISFSDQSYLRGDVAPVTLAA